MSVTILISLLLLILIDMGNMDESAVSLKPSPHAYVAEGETLNLHCHCNGAHTPDFVSWYLNGDVEGLVLDTSDCSIHADLQVYETDRYKPSCSTKNFTLSIFNISISNDNYDTWECDAAIFGVNPQSKAFTTIVVHKTDKPNGNGGGSGDQSSYETTAIIGGISGGLLFMMIPTIFLIRRWKNDGGRKKHVDKFTDSHESQMPLNEKPDPRKSKEQGDQLVKLTTGI